MIIKSYPKVNLGLYIDGKQNNLHTIDSVFVEVHGDLYDVISIEKSNTKDSSISCNINIEDNIVKKAIDLMFDKYNLDCGVNVDLKKSIPIGAGLGGGSSNAAAVIRGIDMLFELDLEYSELIEIGIQIGSDVPFFMYGGVCRVMGIGEKIIPIECTHPTIELYTNDFNMSTKEVFSNFDMNDRFVNNVEEIILMLKTEKFEIDKIHNDLTQAMFRTNKEYADFVLNKMEHNPELLISGSGSTLFMIS